MTEFPFPLTSVAAIVAVTIFLIQMMKGTISDVRWLGAVPIWIYAVIVSFGLTALAALVLHTLAGDFWTLAWQAVGMAATSTGFYEWWKNKTKPLADSGAVTLPPVGTARFVKGLLLVTLLGLGLSACATNWLLRASQVSLSTSQALVSAQQTVIDLHSTAPPRIDQATYDRWNGPDGHFAKIAQMLKDTNAALRAGNRTEALGQVAAACGFIDDLLRDDILKLKPDQQPIVRIALTVLRSTFASLDATLRL